MITRRRQSNRHKSIRPYPQSALLKVLLGNLLDLDPRDLGFSPAVMKVMHDAHVCTVRELLQQTEPMLLRWRGLGPRRVDEIKHRLQLLGLTLGVDPEVNSVHPVIEFLAVSMSRQERFHTPAGLKDQRALMEAVG